MEAEEGRAASLQAQCQAGSQALAHERLALEQDRGRLQVCPGVTLMCAALPSVWLCLRALNPKI